MAIFSRFLKKMRALKGRYGLDVLIQGGGYDVTLFGEFLENFVHFRLVNYTKNRPKMAQNGPKWPMILAKVGSLCRGISYERLL